MEKKRTIKENRSLKKKADLDTTGGLDSTFYSDEEALERKEKRKGQKQTDAERGTK